MTYTPDTPLEALAGIGPKKAQAFQKLGVATLRDLAGLYPRRYEDRTQFRTIADAQPGEAVCIRAAVAAEPRAQYVRSGLTLVKVRIVDDTGALDATYFNQPYRKNSLHAGETYIFYGKVEANGFRKTMTNPVCEQAARCGSVTNCFYPIYPLTTGVTQNDIRKAMTPALHACIGQLQDVIPADIARTYHLAQQDYALQNIHQPADAQALDTARKRLVFEELFVLSTAMARIRSQRRAEGGIRMQNADLETFYRTLPFSPTGAQRRAVAAAVQDMTSGVPMSRLVQGDVGSGKTLVAAACIWFAHENDCQSAFMAPTEILTEQHEHTLRTLLEPFGIRVGRLTGAMTARQKREIKEALAGGLLDVVVGTHALISDSVTFFRLGLVITDEQHRFGVEQRAALVRKGEQPHTLVMSATPIPRTLALLVYGDLDVSIIDELPPGRQPVQTVCVDERYRARLNAFIDKLIGEGRQVFVVCPKVEETDDVPSDLKSAEEHAQALQRTFPQHRVACIHGRMKARDKDACMAAFAAGETDILVSTTVIEVGVDVPNAALMIIENAERFGLSQLHQLRGRIGRGPFQSYCVLVSDAHTEEARARLKVLCDTADGFQIAEADLRQRGPGDFFGNRQHGLPALHIADLGTNMTAVNDARDAARAVLAADPALSAPEHAALRAQCARLFAANDGHFN